jgi:phage terminase small subunit
MKPGRKAEPPSTKAARGTIQPCRDVNKVEVIVPGSPPAQPDYLTAGAIDVWQEEIGRVMATGVVEIDSSLFARYCSIEALIRAAFTAGAPPPAAYLTEARRMAELLGIAGRKSRVGKVTDDPTKQANPFLRNGHGAR